MKLIFTLALLLFVHVSVNAQIPDITQKDSCHLRYDKNHNVIRGQRYAEWQCGKLAGVIDCNDRLEYDESSNMVYMNNQDMVNSSGANKPFSGTCESCFMNGQLERRVKFVNGREEGTDTTYYRTGCPQVVRTHSMGVEHGQWIYYYDSTQYIAWEMNYLMGKKHGKHIYFKKNGDTVRWENYNNDLLDGKKRTYYSKSRIKREVDYKMGVMDGKFKIYNIEGVVIEELSYKQGKKHGECKYFYDDGKPLKNENYNMGMKVGEFKTFFYQGTVMITKTYNKKGQRHGWFMEYYPDGTTKRRAYYEKNELLEEHRYDEQGRETYAFGEPDNVESEDDEMPTGKKKKSKKKKR